MQVLKVRLAIAASLLATVAKARPLQECCSLLAAQYPNDVFAKNTTTWEDARTDFWSATEALHPSCVFFPDSTEKVSGAVALFSRESCKFAIKGGGHSAIPGAANIDDGIFVPLQYLNTTEVNTSEEFVIAGAGLRLGAVYNATGPYNYAPIIGRYNSVGLGLGVSAGISYFSNQEGLTIDNILNYEVVLGNGTVVNANATSHPDLFWALKGGNNNFGVVTHFKLRILPVTPTILGGVVYHAEDVLDRVQHVFYDYHTRQAVDDVKTHALPQFGYNGTSNETIAFTPLFYNDGNITELPPIMREWTDTPNYKNTLRQRNLSSLAVELNDGFPDGLMQEQRILSVWADEQLYKDLFWRFRVWMQGFRDVEGFYGLHVSMPITARQVQEGVDKGTNALGLEEAIVRNRTLGLMYFGITFNKPEDAERVLPAHAKFVQSQIEYAESRGLLHRYIMCSYSGFDQPVLNSYGVENVARMLTVSRKYDPQGVFQKLVPGGQKLPTIPQ